MASLVRERRLQRVLHRARLRDEDLLSEDELACALPGPISANLAWIRARLRPCGTVGKTRVYYWRDALAAIVGAAPAHAEAVPAGRASPSRPAPAEPIFRDPDALVSTADAAALLGLKQQTLRLWRLRGRGPAFVKIGSRVMYRAGDVTSWIASRMFSSTSAVSAASRRDGT